jgi:hypothetical protein
LWSTPSYCREIWDSHGFPWAKETKYINWKNLLPYHHLKRWRAQTLGRTHPRTQNFEENPSNKMVIPVSFDLLEGCSWVFSLRLPSPKWSVTQMITKKAHGKERNVIGKNSCWCLIASCLSQANRGCISGCVRVYVCVSHHRDITLAFPLLGACVVGSADVVKKASKRSEWDKKTRQNTSSKTQRGNKENHVKGSADAAWLRKRTAASTRNTKVVGTTVRKCASKGAEMTKKNVKNRNKKNNQMTEVREQNRKHVREGKGENKGKNGFCRLWWLGVGDANFANEASRKEQEQERKSIHGKKLDEAHEDKLEIIRPL